MENFADRLYWFRLGTWVRNHPVSAGWTRILNDQLDATSDTVALIDGYTAVVGNLLVWIENFPYCYGYPYPSTTRHPLGVPFTKDDLQALNQEARRNHTKFGGQLPDRKTVLRLHKAVRKARAAL